MSSLKKYKRLAGTAKNYFRFSPLAWIKNVSWFNHAT